MTSLFHTMEPTARIKHYQLTVGQLQCLVEFIRMWHQGEVCYLRLSGCV